MEPQSFTFFDVFAEVALETKSWIEWRRIVQIYADLANYAKQTYADNSAHYLYTVGVKKNVTQN